MPGGGFLLELWRSFIGMFYMYTPFFFITYFATYTSSWLCIIICIVLAFKSRRKFSKTFSRPIWKYLFLIVIAGYAAVFFAESISLTIDAFAIQGGSFGRDIPKAEDAFEKNILFFYPVIIIFTICYAVEYVLRSRKSSKDRQGGKTCSM